LKKPELITAGICTVSMMDWPGSSALLEVFAPANHLNPEPPPCESGDL
jgi:hypothetical protein